MAVRLNCYFKLNSQNIANNTSNVTAYIDAISNYGSYNYLNPGGSVTFGGNASGTYNFNHNFSPNTTTRIYERTFNVTHNNDGTGRVTMNATFVTNVSSGTIYGSASLTLPSIARASQPTVSGTTALGSTMTINTNRALSSFTHTLKWSWAGKSGTIATGVATSTTWTPDIATFAPYLTNATSATCTITCDTYSGSTLIGSKSTTINLAIPASVTPRITGIAIEDTAGYFDTYGAYVRGKSSLNVSITAETAYGAGITTYAAGFSSNAMTSQATNGVDVGIPYETSVNKVSVAVTDTRGRRSTASQAIKVEEYNYPTLIGTRAYRYDTTTNTENDESTTIRVHCEGSCTDIGGSGKNTCTVTIRWRQQGASQWTNANIADRGTSFSFDYDLTDKSETSIFEISVVVIDQIGSQIENITTISTASPTMDFKSDGKGIGMFCTSEKPGLQLRGDLILDALKSGENVENYTAFLGANYVGDLISLIEIAIGGTYVNLFRPVSGSWADEDNPPIVSVFSHLYMENNKAIASKTTAGALVSMLRMNTSNQVELNWTSGGLRGRCMKQIWSGTWVTGNITVPEIGYYNVVIFAATSNLNTIGLALRYPGQNRFSAYVIEAASNRAVVDVAQWTLSGTTVTKSTNFHISLHATTLAGGVNQGGVYRIWGVL